MVRARFIKSSACLSILTIQAISAQTQIDLKTQSKAVDFQAAQYTKPLRTGTALPATCTLNELFFLTTAAAGSNIYACISTNNWLQEGGSSVLGGDLSGSSSTAVVQGIQAFPVSAAAPQLGQALIWDGTNWLAESLSSTAGQIIVQNNSTVVGTRGVINYIAGAGMIDAITDTGTKIDLQQNVDTSTILSKATNQSGQSLLCEPASGSGTAYACAMNPTLTAYQRGMVLYFTPDVTAAGGATTINIDILGPQPLKLYDGAANPAAGALLAGQQYAIWYDGTNFRLMAPPADPTLLSKAGNQAGQSLLCKPASGSGTAYTCAMNPTLTAYQTGMVLYFIPDVTGAGGATTVNIDTLGANPLKLADGATNPVAGDLVAGQQYAMSFDGTNFRLMAPPEIGFGSLAAQPTCDSAHRGRLWQTFGGPGVKDQFTVCAKDATDAYAWRVLY